MDRRSRIKELIRTIPDFPRPGIEFRDVSTLFADPLGTAMVAEELAAIYAGRHFDKIIAIESRGFLIGGALSYLLKTGLVIARKPGKLPGQVARISYELEYGSDSIEMHRDSVAPGERCLILDDLIATGGTCAAVCRLVEELGGRIDSCAFIVNLPDLEGVKQLSNYDLNWLVEFSGH